MPSSLPRIRVWKGNLIKLFSDMFIGTNGKYGAFPVSSLSEILLVFVLGRFCLFLFALTFQFMYFLVQIKDISQTCYSKLSQDDVNSDEFLHQSINTAVGNLVNNKVLRYTFLHFCMVKFFFTLVL
jgi:hypothetical protein